jgi:hypothetical protein
MSTLFTLYKYCLQNFDLQTPFVYSGAETLTQCKRFVPPPFDPGHAWTFTNFDNQLKASLRLRT